MKKVFNFSFVVLLILFLGINSYAVNSISGDPTNDEDSYSSITNSIEISEISEYSLKEIQKVTGTKFSLKEKAGFLYAKTKVKKLKRKGYSNQDINNIMAAGDFTFSFVGFILGFFLSLLGLILAWIFFGTTGLKSAAFGMIFSAILLWLAVR